MPFGKYTCRVQWDIVLHGVAGPQGKEIWGRTSSQSMQLQIAAKLSVLCCHLANTNKELGGLVIAIPPFTKLLWSLFESGDDFIEHSTLVTVRQFIPWLWCELCWLVCSELNSRLLLHCHTCSGYSDWGGTVKPPPLFQPPPLTSVLSPSTSKPTPLVMGWKLQKSYCAAHWKLWNVTVSHDVCGLFILRDSIVFIELHSAITMVWFCRY